MREVTWTVEELRVSLFAQQLGTPDPASAHTGSKRRLGVDCNIALGITGRSGPRLGDAPTPPVRPDVPIQRCWWHPSPPLALGVYADKADHRWATTPPASSSMALASRPLPAYAPTCGGAWRHSMDQREMGGSVLERVMRELNARTDIGGSRWSVAGLHDLLPSNLPG